MGRERITIEHLWKERAGLETDYSVPAVTTYLRPGAHDRESDGMGVDADGAITRPPFMAATIPTTTSSRSLSRKA